MKHKITYRLVSYFSIVLFLFSAIVGVLFWILYAKHTIQLQEEELKEQVISIADNLSGFYQIQQKGPGKGGGYGAFLRLVDQIVKGEIWLVDEKAQRIEIGHGNLPLSYEEIPESAEELIQEIFHGKVEVSREFSTMLEALSVTAGAPVFDENGKIIGALLLHSPVKGMGQAQRDGILILVICILIALLLAIFLAILLVHHFIEPLKKMEKTTNKLMEGDYLAQTGVTQEDEIGFLAHNIDELSRRLSELNQEQENLDKMRQDFVSNISHELRTPVTVIKGSLEVLQEGLVTEKEEMQEYFTQMLKDTNHLQRLVNDLLELSRLQNTEFKIENEQMDLVHVVEEVVRSLKPVSEKKNVTILLKNDIGTYSFLGDYGRLRQMFMIVLDNAIKFSLSEGIVNVVIKKEKNQCIVWIEDFGTGMSSEDILHLFDRFYRTRSCQNKLGTGLGLSIAKEIAIRHQVEIDVKSELGKGTCFLFRF